MPDTTYNLAPSPVWQFTDFAAKYLKNGKMYTYRDTARTEPKPVYTDPEGLIPWPNPLILSDPDGSAYPIYWASDENYYVELYDENDNLKYVFTDFNAPGFVPSPDVLPKPPYLKNYILDGQFNFPIVLSFPNIQRGTFIDSQWIFSKTNPSSSTDVVSFIPFLPGQNLVPSTPYNYLRISCTATGSDLEKTIEHFINNVISFENQTMTYSFWARSSTSSTVGLQIIQDFGTGGSPQIVTNITTFNLNPNWEIYSATFDVPSTSGNTRGPNGDDTFSIGLTFPLASIFTVDFVNVQFVQGDIVQNYDYWTYQQDRALTMGQKLPIPALGNPSPDQGKYVTLGTETTSTSGAQPAFVLTTLPPVPLYTGFVMMVFANPPGSYPGWAPANGTFLSAYENNSEAYNLYQLLQQNYLDGSEPVGVGDDGFIPSLVDGGINVLITNESNGDAINAEDINTGLVIDTTSEGSISTPQETKIYCQPADDLIAGTYFYINAISHEWVCYIKIDGEGQDPQIFGKISIPIPLASGMTMSQVAEVIAFQLQGAIFITPDLTGYFPRFGPTNPLSVRDPDFSTRTGGNFVTSTQLSALQQHMHTYNAPTTPVGQGGGDTAFAGTVATATSGVNAPVIPSNGETRGINIYLFPLIKL